jgi:hypothetical protein
VERTPEQVARYVGAALALSSLAVGALRPESSTPAECRATILHREVAGSIGLALLTLDLSAPVWPALRVDLSPCGDVVPVAVPVEVGRGVALVEGLLSGKLRDAERLPCTTRAVLLSAVERLADVATVAGAILDEGLTVFELPALAVDLSACGQ